jgi:alkanesulfonate monooxygenase SsuD/methylene tetrahydromethanopterin reductase-like flavin-dependent oxidoreductase (luciferase family)
MLIGNPGGARDTWTVLAGLAARTKTVKLGSLVSPVTFRHPSVLARMAVTVDEIAGGGRVEVGLGAGWVEAEHREYGFPFPPLGERLEQLREQAEIVRRTWTGEPFDFSGRHYRLEGCRPRPVPEPPPRLILGGVAKRGTIDPAVELADEYNTHFCSVEECRERYAAVAAACEAAGRAPLPFSLMMNCLTASREDELERRRARWTDTVGRPPDESRTIVGTFDAVLERLRAYETAGVDRILLQDLSLNLELIADYGELARRLDGR